MVVLGPVLGADRLPAASTALTVGAGMGEVLDAPHAGYARDVALSLALPL